MHGDLVERPCGARTFASRRRVRLDDMDSTGRVRLDALARFMQDAAIDDVDETGWGAPAHLWFVRWIRLEIVVPLVTDRSLDVVTWCSGTAAAAAGRRWSIVGDRGGRAEADSVWIHLGPDARPARIEGFGVYAGAAAGRVVSTRLTLPAPPDGASTRPWPLRATDVDLHGHVNNAVVWQAVEDMLAGGDRLARPLRADVDFRQPLDPGDEVAAVRWDAGGRAFAALAVGTTAKAVVRLEPRAGARGSASPDGAL